MERKPEDWPVFLTSFELLDENGYPKKIYDYGHRIRVRMTYQTRRALEKPNFIIAFIRSDGVACCNYCSETDGLRIERVDGKGVIELVTPPITLVSDLYTVQVLIREKQWEEIVCAVIGTTVHVRHNFFDRNFGVYHEPGKWSWQNES